MFPFGAVLACKGLVVCQFVILIFMIFSTLTIAGQMKYIRERDLGFDKDQVLAVQLYGNQLRYAVTNTAALKSEFLGHSGISGETLTSKLLGERIGVEDFRPSRSGGCPAYGQLPIRQSGPGRPCN